jgi:integrase
MEMRQVVTYRNYQARIIFAPSDQRFHASWSIGGSRGKVSAKTLEEAKVKALTKLKLIAEGRFSLASINQREEAKISSALTILRESGYHDLLEVALDYITIKKATSCEQPNNLTQSIHHQNRSTKRISFSEAADQWLCFKRPGWSEINTKIIQTRLVRIKESLPLDVCDVNHSVLTEYISRFNNRMPKTRNHFREILKGVLTFSHDRGWIEGSQLERLRRILKNESAPSESPKIMTSESFKRLLGAAHDTELLPIIAIAGFTGARQAEILRLNWANIWARSSHVELEAHLTKTRRRRLVPRSLALEDWLKNYRNATGPVWPHTVKAFEARYYRLREKVGIRGNNLLRHSYASYRITQIGENELAKEMGNSPEMIYSNYRELVEPNEADDWFNVQP